MSLADQLDRGNLSLGRVRQQTRHLAPTVARATLDAVAVTLLTTIVSRLIDIFDQAGVLAIAFLWVRVGIKIAAVLARSHRFNISFHERGLDVATGVLHRRKKFIWYYQLTEEATYVRTPVMYLTHTASLQLAYNDTPTTHTYLELTGIGSPSEVERIRAYLETRRLAERIPMHGFFT
jgi:membrane protein YdbS with pleckstrin-like domain